MIRVDKRLINNNISIIIKNDIQLFVTKKETVILILSKVVRMYIFIVLYKRESNFFYSSNGHYICCSITCFIKKKQKYTLSDI